MPASPLPPAEERRELPRAILHGTWCAGRFFVWAEVARAPEKIKGAAPSLRRQHPRSAHAADDVAADVAAVAAPRRAIG